MESRAARVRWRKGGVFLFGEVAGAAFEGGGYMGGEGGFGGAAEFGPVFERAGHGAVGPGGGFSDGGGEVGGDFEVGGSHFGEREKVAKGFQNATERKAGGRRRGVKGRGGRK